MLSPTKRAVSVLLSTLLMSGALSACKTNNFTSQPATKTLKPKVVTTPKATIPATPQTEPVEAVNPAIDSTLDSETWTLDPAQPPAKEPEEVKPEPPAPPAEPKFNSLSESFTQHGVTGAADILIVVDNSNSMREEQKNLSDKLSALIGALKDADWQIGIVTTSVKTDKNGDKCEIALIKSNEQNIHDRFAKAVQPGIDGDVNEQGIRQAVNGLKCSSKKWVRDNSTVAVLLLSDEDNCSNGKGCNSSPAKTEQYLIDYVEQEIHRTVGMNAGFYGIFAPPGEKCKTAGNVANIYQRLVNYRSMGQKNYGNICDSSYQSTLEQISKNIAKLLTSQFKLKEKPFAGSVVVSGRKTNGNPIQSSDYNVNEDVISFNPGNEPALESEITVTYKVQVN